MSTAYYAHLNVCPHCEVGEVVHLGQSAIGRTFLFHATDSLRSWEDWKIELRRSTTRILNEYGERIQFEGFEDMVKKMQHGNHRSAKDHLNAGGFLDPEGFAFYDGDFS